MKKANIIVSVILILAALFFIHQTSMLKEVTTENIGPKTFPYIVLGGIVVLSGLNLLLGLKEQKEGKFIEKSEFINVIVTMVLILLYLFLLDNTNFIISTIVFLILLSSFYYGKKDKKLIFIVGFSVAITIAIYFLFNDFFKILLP